VVAATPLGDVVKQGGDVDQPGLLEAGAQAGQQRVLMGMLGHHEAAHIAQHLQNVLIHRVYVEEVVLHLANDASPGRQVEAQYAVLVHAPHFVHHPALLLQQAQEEGTIGRVLPEFGVDQLAAPPQGTERAGRHALQFGALLEEQEALEQGAGVAVEDAFVAYVEEFAHTLGSVR
jgi:hypothetical protein